MTSDTCTSKFIYCSVAESVLCHSILLLANVLMLILNYPRGRPAVLAIEQILSMKNLSSHLKGGHSLVLFICHHVFTFITRFCFVFFLVDGIGDSVFSYPR